MSNKRTFSKFSQPQEKTKYCSVCHKAGKSEREYTSHFIKSIPGPNGIVICPTILSSECKFCFKLGHWASEEYCPALREKKKREKKEEYNRAKQQAQPVIVAAASTISHLKQISAYGALAYDSDSEDKPRPSPTEDFPPLGNACMKDRVLPTAFSYADMAKKEAPIVVREEKSAFEYDVLSRREPFDKPNKSNLFATAVTSGRAGNFEELEIEEREDGDESSYVEEEYYEDDDWGYVPQLAVRTTSENW